MLEGGDVVPGFQVRLVDLFARGEEMGILPSEPEAPATPS